MLQRLLEAPEVCGGEQEEQCVMLDDWNWLGEGWITKIKPSTTALRWKEQKSRLQTFLVMQKVWQHKRILGVQL